jgi:hypothetical protein
MKRLTFLFVCFFILTFSALTTYARNWPSFRGPNDRALLKAQTHQLHGTWKSHKTCFGRPICRAWDTRAVRAFIATW